MVATSAFSQQRKETRNQKKEDRKEKIQLLQKQEEEGAMIFHKQNAFGVRLYSDGYSAFYELGILKTPVKTSLYSLEIGERKHPKEDKLSRGVLGFAVGNPFIYGKINNFYFTKLGYGQQRLLGVKGNKNGVAVSALYGGGFSAGLLKPYYITVNNARNEQEQIKYNNNNAVFLSATDIIGASGFGKGFNEIKFVPGGFAKTALRFDYGRYNEVVSAIEVGLGAEFYSQKMPILLLNKEKQLFFNAYAAIVFGKRK
ncbi:MAG: hypothetical protein JWQ96_2589 [Segetibacter sp.]|nr:hypothetical protein [Segetibacter sp.]